MSDSGVDVSDPKRLLEADDEASLVGASLLREGLDLEPPPGAREAAWAALATKLGPSRGGGSSGGDSVEAPSDAATNAGSSAETSGAAAAASGGLSLGSAIAGLLVLSLGVGGYVALSDRTKALVVEAGQSLAPITTSPVVEAPSLPATASALADSPPSAIQQAPRASEVGSAATPGSARSTSPRAASSIRASASPTSAPATDAANDESATEGSASTLREESRALAEARGLLRAGAASAALARLDQMQAQFPRGALGEEREALALEALAGSGQSAAARARAQAFLALHPTSPYAATLQRFAE